MKKYLMPWIAAGTLALIFAVGSSYGEDMLVAARAEQEQQQLKTAHWRDEYRALQNDRAEGLKLRADMGEAAWRNLVAPPPRAQIVAALRQIGIEAGLNDFELKLGSAASVQALPAAPESWPLTSSALTVKATAATDRQIFAFAEKASRQAPGYIRLEKFAVRRDADHLPDDAPNPSLIAAEMEFKWLAFAEDRLMARAKP
ncbi:MAG: hypothetical protein WDO70_09140 [Alphaproteobacteria bacterium]